MVNLKLKTITVDGEKRVVAYVNGKFAEEVDCFSQFSPKEAKQYLREKYLK